MVCTPQLNNDDDDDDDGVDDDDEDDCNWKRAYFLKRQWNAVIKTAMSFGGHILLLPCVSNYLTISI